MYTKKEIIETITNPENGFVAVEFENGHLHTVKTDDEICETPYDGEYKGQINYIWFVREKENTLISDVRSAKTREEAVEEEIINENGEIF